MRSGMLRALSKLQAHLSARPRDTGSTPAVRRCVAGALVPVSDLDRSITLYQDLLGLEGSPTPTGYRLRAAAGSAIYLLPGTDYAGSRSDRW